MKISIIKLLAPLATLLFCGAAFAQGGHGLLEGKYTAGPGCDFFGLPGDTIFVSENIPASDPDSIPQAYLTIAFDRLVPLNEQTPVELQYSNGKPFRESGNALTVGSVSQRNMGEGSELETGVYSSNGDSFEDQYIEFTQGKKIIKTDIVITSGPTGLDVVLNSEDQATQNCHLQK